MKARDSSHYQGYAACSGCSLCLLACPVWHASRDIRFTPHGRAKALQHGASAQDLVASIDSCTLCGACEPACPEEIDLISMVLGLRTMLGRALPVSIVSVHTPIPATEEGAQRTAAVLIVPDRVLSADAILREHVVQLFGGSAKAQFAVDIGTDIAWALEAGAPISDERRLRFLTPLRVAKRLIVGDGILLRALRSWLPGKNIESIGVAASSLDVVRTQLRATDFYMIEPRAYHADRERLVNYYDALRLAHGCAMNMDLQRLAIPTTAGSLPDLLGMNLVNPQNQARWMLEGHDFLRIVVEDASDIAVFQAITDKPVLHLSQLISR